MISGVRGRICATVAAVSFLALSTTARADDVTLVAYYQTSRTEAALQALDWLKLEINRFGASLIDLSPGAEPPVRAPGLLQSAIVAYEKQSYVQAVARLDEAIAEASHTGAASLTPSQLADLFLYRGLAKSKLGSNDESWADFVRAASVDVTRRLDPARFPPRVLRTMDRAFSLVRGDRRTQLSIVPTVSGCSITLDGRSVLPGQSTAIPAGEHYVQIRCPRYKPHRGRITVSDTIETYRPKLVAESLQPKTYLSAARERGANQLVVVAFVDTPPTVTMQTIDLASGQRRKTVVVGATDRTKLRSGLEVLIGTQLATDTPTVIVREKPTPWYRNPWLWGAAGVVVGAAVILPFAVGDTSDALLDVRPTGLP